MRAFGNAGCVSTHAFRGVTPNADGTEKDGEEGEDEGCGEAEGRSQDEAEVALARVPRLETAARVSNARAAVLFWDAEQERDGFHQIFSFVQHRHMPLLM